MNQARLAFMTALLRSFRQEILADYGHISADIKHDKSVVTEMDTRIEEKITNVLLQEFPDLGVLGEEHGQQGNKSSYWMVDPIDGTENYVRGLPGITTIIGLVEDGEVSATYIYDIVNDVVFHAQKGHGAFKDATLVSIVERPVERSMIALTSSVSPALNDAVNAMKEKAHLQHALSIHGCGYKSIILAEGKVDGIVAFNGRGSVWDYAPTTLLNIEAGAVYIPLEDKGIETNHYALLSPSISEQLEPIIKEYA